MFTAADGRVFRTVSANLGMSYSALNVAETGGLETIRQVLGDGVDAREVWHATHRMLKRPAAVKLIRPDILAKEGPTPRRSSRVSSGKPAPRRP